MVIYVAALIIISAARHVPMLDQSLDCDHASKLLQLRARVNLN
jgi:hypothetical protein